MQRELLRVIGDDRSFESFAGLALEIVDVIDADSAKPVPVRSGKKVAVDRSAGREQGLRSGAEAGSDSAGRFAQNRRTDRAAAFYRRARAGPRSFGAALA